MPIKPLSTSKGVLCVGECFDVKYIIINEFDIIWNLGAELQSYLPLELELGCCVMFGNIIDGSSPEDSIKFLSQLIIAVNCLKNDGRVFIHCFAGHGRTGTAVACIKIKLDDFSVEDALSYSLAECSGPETKIQTDFVKSIFEKFR
jgi:hypothetical protein